MCQHAVFTEDSVQSISVFLPTEFCIEMSQAIDGQLEVIGLKGVSCELIIPPEVRLCDGIVTAHHEGLCCKCEHSQIGS